MTTTVITKDFQKAIKALAFNVPKKAELGSLTSIKVQVFTDYMRLYAFDKATELQINVSCNSKITGEYLLHYDTLKSAVSSCKGKEIQLQFEDDQLRVKSGKSKFKLSYTNGVYPATNLNNNIEGYSFSFQYAISILKILAANICTHDLSRKVLAGVCIIQKSDRVLFAATDGHKFAEFTLHGETLLEDGQQVIIPAKEFMNFVSSVAEKDEELKFGIEGNIFSFYNDKYRYTGRVLEGSYPKYDVLFPSQEHAELQVQTKQLIEAVKGAMSVFNRDDSYLDIKVEDGFLALSGKTEIGSSEFQCDFTGKLHDMSGETVRLNAAYLLSVLKLYEATEFMTLNLFKYPQPVVFTEEAELVRSLLMPVRVV